jgi:hypothetical protein
MRTCSSPVNCRISLTCSPYPPGAFKQLVRRVVVACDSQPLFKLLKTGKPARARQLGHDVLEWRHARLEGPQHIACGWVPSLHARAPSP